MVYTQYYTQALFGVAVRPELCGMRLPRRSGSGTRKDFPAKCRFESLSMELCYTTGYSIARAGSNADRCMDRGLGRQGSIHLRTPVYMHSFGAYIATTSSLLGLVFLPSRAPNSKQETDAHPRLPLEDDARRPPGYHPVRAADSTLHDHAQIIPCYAAPTPWTRRRGTDAGLQQPRSAYTSDKMVSSLEGQTIGRLIPYALLEYQTPTE